MGGGVRKGVWEGEIHITGISVNKQTVHRFENRWYRWGDGAWAKKGVG